MQTPNWRTPPDSIAWRLSVLPAAVEILLAAGDVVAARSAADALARVAEQSRTVPARAKAATAVGAVLLAEEDSAAAVQALRDAVGLWNDLDAPYEMARARLILAQAYRAEDAADRAALEVRASRAALEALGARLDLARADALLDELRASAGDLPQGMATTRVERVFMFTDIVGSTRLAEEMGDARWDGVIRAHDRILRSAAAASGGVEVKATGDGFFFAFPDPDQAVESAIRMQRDLATSAEDDSALPMPPVRIGMHMATANRVGLDFVGSGVNQAARIAGAAAGGEILLSEATLRASRRQPAIGERRVLELRGVSAPVAVLPVRWQP